MTRSARRVLLQHGALLVAGLAVPGLARAQGRWRPSQPVRIVVPAAAGGTTDIMGRLLAPFLQERWGQPVVVDNRSGAGGTLGAAEVVRAKPDGHTILIGNIGPQAIAYSLFRGLSYRPDQLIPVSNMIRGPNALMLHPSLPVRTVPDFVRYLKENPGKLNYSTSGPGQSPHLSGVWFHQLTGTQATAIHYRGAGPAMVGMVAGDVQFGFDNLTSSVEQIRAGQVRGLGVTSADRNPQMPELPALRETMPELAQYDVSTWFGAFLPAGTPEPVVQALNAEIKALLELPVTQRRFAEMGGVPAYGTPAEYSAFVQAEIEKWGGVVRKEGLQMDIG
ncbi:tripartite tricarboxylate transporter substrate binding protein [Pseudoroseomonas wenyumeiae]|uniref:Tripartite tricarboxylate transporter substrate binding protein n=1 Tax=Teichococcus wenyumeiae TaxID=2478470 RepID=A0A3A9JPC8_9PROT|nr:tripartite tricarboxylate transporter substrate binding protein [Pseudoroseomonas wenyumeiae]RKK05736.1 tripartite tricarboxylate transporter substrate binding protein [Pseudoroseomonas wenyumeiae]RMI24950.1 tripartite tricarboxylate transporter substrate binding protein [Pseudoroseomonas wenyumeiae]